nr:uncharacterized protein LOC127315437 [Lolium perenne]
MQRARPPLQPVAPPPTSPSGRFPPALFSLLPRGMASDGSNDGRRRSDRWLASDDDSSSGRGSRSYRRRRAHAAAATARTLAGLTARAARCRAGGGASARARLLSPWPPLGDPPPADAAPRGADAEGWLQPRREHHQPTPSAAPHRRHAAAAAAQPSPERRRGLVSAARNRGTPFVIASTKLRCRRYSLSGHGSRTARRSGASTTVLASASHRCGAPRPPGSYGTATTTPAPPPLRRERAMVVAPTLAPAAGAQGPDRVIVPYTSEMEEAEAVPRRAMVATITGTRPAVTADAVSHLLCTTFDLHPDRVSGDHFLSTTSFSLNLRPWFKLAHAGCDRLDQRVEVRLRGIPAQAWQLSTGESLLRGSCWVESLYAETRTRADMATFRLTARARDPDAIRRHAVLEVVEIIPAHSMSQAPTLRTLTYPISIDVGPAAAVAPAMQRADNPGRGTGGAGDGRADHDDGRPQARRRGRGCKRRRPYNDSPPPPGRADGMAMDSLPWAIIQRGRRADGVACDALWPPPRAPAAASGVRTMQPWPGQGGPRRQSRRSFWRRKDAAPDPTTAHGPPPGADQVQNATRVGTDGAPSVATPPTTTATDPTTASTPSSSTISGANPAAPTPSQEAHPVCRNQETAPTAPSFEGSEVPTPSPVTEEDRLSGNSCATPPSASAASVDASVDRSTELGREETAMRPRAELASPVATQADQVSQVEETQAQEPPAQHHAADLVSQVEETQAQAMQALDPLAQHHADGPRETNDAATTTPSKFKSPPVVMRRLRQRARTQQAQPQPSSFTLGEFLTAATSSMGDALPTPRKRPRRLLVFSPRCGRSAARSASAT